MAPVDGSPLDNRKVSDPDHTFLKLDIARTLLSSTAHVDLDEAERIFKWITSK